MLIHENRLKTGDMESGSESGCESGPDLNLVFNPICLAFSADD